KKMPTWASDISLIRKIQVIQNKLQEKGLLRDDLEFETVQKKREFLQPKVYQLCKLMDSEYEVNYKKLRKQHHAPLLITSDSLIAP
ncbi:hypothetical protein, partial [Rossellomorea marisflavi]